MNINLRLLEKKLNDIDNDSLKINLFSVALTDNLRKVILNSISCDENKLKCLKYGLNDTFIIDVLLPVLESEESKLKAISQMSFAESKLNAIIKYLNDENKLKCLDFFTTVNYKTKLIESLENDEIKYEYLDYIDDNFFKEKVINSIKDENVLEKILSNSTEYIIIKTLKNTESDYLKIKYLNYIENDIEKANVINTLRSDEERINEIYRLNDVKAKEIVLHNLSSKEMSLENVNLLNNEIDIVNYVSKFNFALLKEVKNEDYLLNIFSSFYDVPLKHLKVFLDMFGYNIFKKMSSDNIKSILRFEEEDFQKFIKLFEKDNITLNSKIVNDICFKITSKKFDTEEKDIKNIFHEMLNYAYSNNKWKFNSKLSTMLKSIDREELDKLLLENNIDMDVLKNLYEDITSRAYNSYFIDILHLITNKYVESQRANYINNNIDFIKEKLNTNLVLNKKYVINKKISTLNISEIIEDVESIKNKLTKDEIELFDNKDLFTKCISFKKNPSSISASDRELVGKNLRLFDEIIYKRYGYVNSKFSRSSHLTEYPDAVFDEEFKTVRNINLLDIIDNINLEEFTLNVLENKEVYNDLYNILKKYKILGFGDTFDNIFNLIDVEYNNKICSNIISYYFEFNKLYSSSKKDLLELLYNAELRGESDLKYKILFRDEDYNLIVQDPKLNSSHLNKQQRLKFAVNKIKLMYSNKYLTIPSFDEIIEIDGKKINVIVGNRTNPRNLTLGERTGSCMRIGGQAESLFDFCLCNPNGFHITFLDPETNEVISRVSGFRNGSSIFLNQLRSSVSVKYEDKDLVQALEKVCNEIVNVSEANNDIIDYVFISEDFAMKDENKPNTSFKEDITSGYEDIYTNLKSGAVILYKREGLPKSKSKLNLYITDSKYPLVRDKVREFYNVDAEHEAQRLEMISELLNGKEFSKIKTKYNQIVYLVGGEDWYIALDKNNNFIEYIIDTRKNNEITVKEMNYYKDLILGENYTIKNSKERGM